MRYAKVLIAILLLAVFASPPALADDEWPTQKLALQVSDNDVHKMNSALDIAANVSRHYSALGEEVEIRIVVFNQGVHMVRPDTTPVAQRMKSFAQSMPNVSFVACGNTLETMKRMEGKEIPLLDGVSVVKTGIVELIDLHRKGFTVVKP